MNLTMPPRTKPAWLRWFGEEMRFSLLRPDQLQSACNRDWGG